jgi:hypothetical protein
MRGYDSMNEEGEVTELHVASGTMDALMLKDLARNSVSGEIAKAGGGSGSGIQFH